MPPICWAADIRRELAWAKLSRHDIQLFGVNKWGWISGRKKLSRNRVQFRSSNWCREINSLQNQTSCPQKQGCGIGNFFRIPTPTPDSSGFEKPTPTPAIFKKRLRLLLKTSDSTDSRLRIHKSTTLAVTAVVGYS